MATQIRKKKLLMEGRRQFAAEMPIELIARARAEALRRGMTLKALVEDLLERAVPRTIIIGADAAGAIRSLPRNARDGVNATGTND